MCSACAASCRVVWSFLSVLSLPSLFKMKTAVTALVIVFSAVLCGGRLQKQGFSFTPVDPGQTEAGPQVDKECTDCLDLSEKYLKDLAEIIAAGGATGTCVELCTLLEKKVDRRTVYYVCLGVCLAAGVASFVGVLKKVELDPFCFCDLLHMCPRNPDSDAHIVSLGVEPRDVKQNSSFDVQMVFATKAGTGLGQYDLNITTEGIAVERDNSTEDPLNSGDYVARWTFSAPTDWTPGNYTVGIAICYGQCWSHELECHSKVYDSKKANFTLSRSG